MRKDFGSQVDNNHKIRRLYYLAITPWLYYAVHVSHSTSDLLTLSEFALRGVWILGYNFATEHLSVAIATDCTIYFLDIQYDSLLEIK